MQRSNGSAKRTALPSANGCVKSCCAKSRNEAGHLVLMGEITSLRLLLVNTLEPLLRGDKMTAEQFKEMLRYVKANKRKAAEDTLASYAERSTEQL